MECFAYFSCVLAIVLSTIALAKSGGKAQLHRLIGELRRDLEALRMRLEGMEQQSRVGQEPVPQRPSALTEPAPAAVPIQPPVPVQPLPVLPPAPLPPPRPEFNLDELGRTAPGAPLSESSPQPPALQPEPPRIQPPPRPAPAAPMRPSPRPVPPPKPAAPLPRVVVPAAPPKPPRNIEELLTKLFLRIGVATLVIGVVFFLAYKLQSMGPAGKVLTGLLVGGSLLGTGLFAERRENYRTLGRALIAGAWGILYFVVYAAGFIPAAQVLTRIPGVIALLLAAVAAVGFTLRYRSEWTTISAFLLIFLSLGISAFEVETSFSLGATLIIAIAMAVLLWKLGWVRLLGLGVPATWVTFALILLRRSEGTAAFGEAGLLVIAWLGFQVALLIWQGVFKDEKTWLGAAQLANFAGAVSLSLWVTHLSRPHADWAVALGYGLAHLAVAFLFQRRDRRGLYLLTATEGLAALALVTPLRLGLHHHLTPLYRLIGIELLLAGGVFLRERYFRRLAYAAFLLTALEILFLRMDPAMGVHRLVLTGSAAGFFLLDTVLLRTFWKEACADELPAVAQGFSWAGMVMLLVFLVVKIPQPFVGLWLLGTGFLWIGVAMVWGQKDLGIQGLVLNLTGLIALLAIVEKVKETPNAWIPALGCTLLAAGYAFTRGLRQSAFADSWIRVFAAIQSALGLIALVMTLMIQVAPPWQAPALAGSALIFMALGLWLGFGDLCAEAVILSGFMVLGMLANAEHLGGHRLWSLGLCAAFTLGVEGVLRLAWPRTSWSEKARSISAGGYALLGHLLLVILIFLEVPHAWIAPVLMFLGAGYLIWFRRGATSLKFFLGLAYTLLGFIAIAAVSWGLTGQFFGVPIRMLSILAALGFALAVQDQLQRRAKEDEGDFTPSKLIGLAAPLAVGLLTLACVTLGYYTKVEALAHGKNLLVALAWGLLAVLFLERGKALKSWAWLLHGHLWMAAGFLHFGFVNLLQEGSLGALSLRLITAFPFLGLLSYAYLAWDTHHAEGVPEKIRKGRPAYLYAIQLALALLLLYELTRAYVVVAWALQAFLCLLWGTRKEAHHWMRCASILALACVLRGIGTNLTFRETLASGFSTNAVAIPAACALLLAGYVVLRRRQLTGTEEDILSGAHRLPWFWAQVILLLAAVWVELSGTHLTIFLGMAGLGMVALGFLVEERIARLSGLGVLSFCILKLFIYDLRGLSGPPRWLSFMALGAILILVTFIYTRFKARLERLL